MAQFAVHLVRRDEPPVHSFIGAWRAASLVQHEDHAKPCLRNPIPLAKNVAADAREVHMHMR